MNVTMMSRKNAITYCKQKNPEESVMISISDPRQTYLDDPICSDENKVVDILRLCFADADGEGLDVYGNSVTESDLMTDEDARMVAEFVNKHQDVYILVHCDAGASRSAGIAGAILKYYTGDDSQIFRSSRLCPNMWCYRKTLHALHELCPNESENGGRTGEHNVLTKAQLERIGSLRTRLARAISSVDYENKGRYPSDGAFEVSFVYPGTSSDPDGDQAPSEWELKLTCHFDQERPFMAWWAETLEGALRDCEQEVNGLIERMEASSTDQQ